MIVLNHHISHLKVTFILIIKTMFYNLILCFFLLISYYFGIEMQSPLVVVQPQQTCIQKFCAECLDVTKVMLLVFFTYGLMVLFFEIS